VDTQYNNTRAQQSKQGIRDEMSLTTMIIKTSEEGKMDAIDIMEWMIRDETKWTAR